MNKILLTLCLISMFAFSYAQTSGKLTFNVTTGETNLGYYAPKNIEAIWVEDSSNKFVKTLLKYANARVNYLTLWLASSGGNVVDAKTGATRTSHGTLNCEWNGKDVAGNVVADGTYKIRIQLTDDNFGGLNTTYTFNKGTASVSLNPADVLPSFKNVSIIWSPANTAVEDVKTDNLYSVYPNPTTTGIYINGTDVEEVQVFSIIGKKLLTSKYQYIDLSSLPNGYYFVSIFAKSGNYTKKIQKK